MVRIDHGASREEGMPQCLPPPPPIVAPPTSPWRASSGVKRLIGEEEGSGEALWELWGYLLSSAWLWLAVYP